MFSLLVCPHHSLPNSSGLPSGLPLSLTSVLLHPPSTFLPSVAHPLSVSKPPLLCILGENDKTRSLPFPFCSSLVFPPLLPSALAAVFSVAKVVAAVVVVVLLFPFDVPSAIADDGSARRSSAKVASVARSFARFFFPSLKAFFFLFVRQAEREQSVWSPVFASQVRKSYDKRTMHERTNGRTTEQERGQQHRQTT